MKTKFNSHVQISDDHRIKLVELCNKGLASAMDLFTQTKQAHWNVRGPQFFARHELFDRVADHAKDMADDFAERAGALGGYAEGTVRMSAKQSVLPEYEEDAVTGQQHVKALVARFATFTGFLREGVSMSGEIDVATEDLFTEALRIAEEDLWFLESHLEG